MGATVGRLEGGQGQVEPPETGGRGASRDSLGFRVYTSHPCVRRPLESSCRRGTDAESETERRRVSEHVVRLAADPVSVRSARAFVRDELRRSGWDDRADDAALAVSELAANAVLHARTELTVHVTVSDGLARVEVDDGSAVLPVHLPVGESALSGRGLALVDALTDRWGARPTASGGKTVWFELAAARSAPETSAEHPLEARADLEDLAAASPREGVSTPDGDLHRPLVTAAQPLIGITLSGVDSALLLATRQHSDDLIREMTMLLLNTEARVTDHVAPTAVVRLARRLTAAAEEFGSARHQLTAAAAAAVTRQELTTDVHLRLDPAAAGAAQRYRDALDEADQLAATGALLVSPCPPEQRRLRRWYLSEVISALTSG